MSNLNINIFDLIILLGAIQGIMLSIFLIRKQQKVSKAIFFLALFIFSFSINSIFFSLEGLGIRTSSFTNPMEYIPLLCSLLILASFYFFVEFLIHPNRPFTKKDALLFIPYVVQISTQLIALFFCLTNPQYLLDHAYQMVKVFDIIDITGLIFGWIVLISSIIKINKYEADILKNYSEVTKISLSWVRRFIFLLFLIIILWSIPTLYEQIFNKPSLEIFYPMWIGMSVLVYWMGYTMYFKKEDLKVELFHQEVIEPKMEAKALSEKTRLYYEQLQTLMKEEKPYLNPDLNLKMLAEQLNLSSGYLSQIINQYESKNFFDFVNTYRVNAFKKNLANSKLSHLSLLGIAYESGFKSKSTFNLSFKKLTGLTPSAYKKSLK